MSKKTLYILSGLMVVGIGYWIYRKKRFGYPVTVGNDVYAIPDHAINPGNAQAKAPAALMGKSNPITTAVTRARTLAKRSIT